MADLWSDYSDGVMKNIDRQISTKYKLTLRSLLTDPSKYVSQQNIQITIDNLKEEVQNYADGKAKDMVAEKKAFEDATMHSDALTSQLGQSIAMQAKQNKVPMIKPVAVDRDTTKEERIYVDSVDSGVSALVEKLVSSSVLIADFSAAYGKYKVGEWLFSGSKNYVLAVYLPANSYLLLQSSRDELIGLLDAASGFIKGL
jgi:hypothetical protein